jgi:predicted transcriptional regulator
MSAGIMPEGSVKTSLKKLFDKHQIKKDKEGRYFLPAHRITDLINKTKTKE